jgi:hypothetical protein
MLNKMTGKPDELAEVLQSAFTAAGVEATEDQMLHVAAYLRQERAAAQGFNLAGIERKADHLAHFRSPEMQPARN